MTGGLSGFRAWLLQRVTAIYLALFVLFIPLYMWQQASRDYLAWRGLLAEPVIALLFALFFLALCLHAWVGVRDILVDYVSALGLRFLLLSMTAIILISQLLWAWSILLVNSGVV
ncbi:succinate dehydrogenase, hydrophobic membrane anchor protein [Sulfuriflexus mobilis]|uniref:succinate dehydrogenase, hydrophobic membrane anchor protein n=1 Tax=Sulfuriflexus mobilis TaxID=1811807 RepID=UPI0015587C69|nr:succinate dehydrogenase, hydrophobic membrane anchor protein [Sulfuriflexus mobilis]